MARSNGKRPPVTERQLEILAHVASGLNIDQAAEKCFMAPRSAYNTIGAAKSRVGATTVTHLVLIAIESGWLEKTDRGEYVASANLSNAA